MFKIEYFTYFAMLFRVDEYNENIAGIICHYGTNPLILSGAVK
jgi:hypothetical protein